MIFIDADAYIALSFVKDIHHVKANSLFSELETSDEEYVTSWEVVDEVATKLSRFTSKDQSLKFFVFLFISKTQIEYISPESAGLILNLFKKQTSKKVSLTDCANMVIARRLGVKIFFSFDHHYEQNGFTLLAKTP
jgi:predicted nucleic acid-binding protein